MKPEWLLDRPADPRVGTSRLAVLAPVPGRAAARASARPDSRPPRDPALPGRWVSLAGADGLHHRLALHRAWSGRVAGGCLVGDRAGWLWLDAAHRGGAGAVDASPRLPIASADGRAVDGFVRAQAASAVAGTREAPPDRLVGLSRQGRSALAGASPSCRPASGAGAGRPVSS